MNNSRSVAVLVAVLLLLVLALPIVPAIAAAEEVAFAGDAAPGTIVIRTSERRLYLVLGQGHALRYPVGVGRAGWQWQGTSAIDGKYLNPNWAPPAAIRQEQPNLPALILAGSPANPMGVAAMTLAGGAYAIHGTNTPKLIGGFVSHGCIRMFNADITDLYARVNVGTVVVVTR
jgi:lipoprotein-anchoring transpeptidase ErfK/SrfK